MTDWTTPQLAHDDRLRLRTSAAGAAGGTAASSDASWAGRESTGSAAPPIQRIRGVLAAATVAKTIAATKHVKAMGNRAANAPALRSGLPLTLAGNRRLGVMALA